MSPHAGMSMFPDMRIAVIAMLLALAAARRVENLNPAAQIAANVRIAPVDARQFVEDVRIASVAFSIDVNGKERLDGHEDIAQGFDKTLRKNLSLPEIEIHEITCTLRFDLVQSLANHRHWMGLSVYQKVACDIP